jgi:hypothetical protein
VPRINRESARRLNEVFSQWEQIFKDPMTTAAAIDRLVHHSVILELNLPSHRMEAAQKKRGAAASSTPRTDAVEPGNQADAGPWSLPEKPGGAKNG